MRIVLIGVIMVLMSCFTTLACAEDSGYIQLYKAWAVAKYQTPSDQREKAFGGLVERAAIMLEQQPDSPELWIWSGIILSTYAGEQGGLGALGLVKEAKQQLERAIQLNGDALQGAAYTSLGSLYYQVPGWPIGFGDDDKAREYLEKGLSINPDGMDSNYFYGDFLLEEGEYAKAVQIFEKALSAPVRVNRPIADQGRRQEIEIALAKARHKL